MRRIGIILLFFILLGFVVFLGGELPYFLFYTFVLSVLLPLIHSMAAIVGLKGKIIIPQKTLYKDDTIDIYYKIKNRTLFSIPYLIIDSKIHPSMSSDTLKVITSLSRKEYYQYSKTIKLQKRGYCNIGGIEVIVQDIFKIFKFKKIISSNIPILVYPKTIVLSSLRINSNQHQGNYISHNQQFDDRTVMNSLREYVEGDNLKYIHWKLTAKKDQPMVKLYDNSADNKVFIFIDNSIHSYKDDIEGRLEDKAVDIALSIIDYSFNNNIDFALFYQAQDKNLEIHSKDMDDIKVILEALAKFKANGKIIFSEFLSNNIENINKYSSVIIITPHLNKDIGITALDLLSIKAPPHFFVVEDQKNNTGFLDENIRKKLMKENIYVYPIDYSTNIKTILECNHE